jgi:UDP-glucose 4-epimerase
MSERRTGLIRKKNAKTGEIFFRHPETARNCPPMNIIITGGAGFIGSHLAEKCVREGHRVTILDNFSTGKIDNLATFTDKVTIHTMDISDFSALLDVTRDADAIVHLAAVASVQASVEEPQLTHKSNMDGTINLLEAARINHISTFVFASSAAVYGNTQQLPVSEQTAPAPLTPYAVDKLASEYYIQFYRRQHGLNTAIFRFFNVFGPRQDPSSPYSGVISILIDRALQQKKFTLFGSGKQSRDFIYVKDLVDILYQATSATNNPPVPINAGNGEQTSLLELIAAINALSGHELCVEKVQSRPGDIEHSRADISALKEYFHFSPQWDIRQGLQKTLEWHNA